jgi:hypothetical protein
VPGSPTLFLIAVVLDNTRGLPGRIDVENLQPGDASLSVVLDCPVFSSRLAGIDCFA